MTLILLPTHSAKRNGQWDVLQRERKQNKQKKPARMFQVLQPRSEEERAWSVWLARISCSYYWVRSEIPTQALWRKWRKREAPLLLRNKQLWGTHLDKQNHIFPARELFLISKACQAIDVDQLKSRFQRALRTWSRNVKVDNGKCSFQGKSRNHRHLISTLQLCAIYSCDVFIRKG